MKYLIILLAFIPYASALAFDLGGDTTANAAAAQGQMQGQGQAQGQLQGQGQGQGQAQLSAQANEQGVNIVHPKQDFSDTYDGYAASAYAPNMPLSDCEDGIPIGLTVAGIGSATLGASSTNDKCWRERRMVLGLMSDDVTIRDTAKEIQLLDLQADLADVKEEETVRLRSAASTEGYDWDALGG